MYIALYTLVCTARKFLSRNLSILSQVRETLQGSGVSATMFPRFPRALCTCSMLAQVTYLKMNQHVFLI